jgi:3-phosphoshikimate 1-carboxyvinyltransferase
MPQPLTSSLSQRLSGRARVPGDKSISHRTLILGALATGRTRIEGLLEAEDVMATAKAIAALGAEVKRVNGRAIREPAAGSCWAPLPAIRSKWS